MAIIIIDFCVCHRFYAVFANAQAILWLIGPYPLRSFYVHNSVRFKRYFCNFETVPKYLKMGNALAYVKLYLWLWFPPNTTNCRRTNHHFLNFGQTLLHFVIFFNANYPPFVFCTCTWICQHPAIYIWDQVWYAFPFDFSYFCETAPTHHSLDGLFRINKKSQWFLCAQFLRAPSTTHAPVERLFFVITFAWEIFFANGI